MTSRSAGYIQLEYWVSIAQNAAFSQPKCQVTTKWNAVLPARMRILITGTGATVVPVRVWYAASQSV